MSTEAPDTPDTQPPPATPPQFFGTDGTLAENWHLGLGDEFSPHAAALAPFKNVAGLAKSYLKFRGNGPSYPTEASTTEDISRFHALAQVPVEGTPQGYGLTIPEGASDLDKQVFYDLSKVARDNHVSAPGFRKLVEAYQTIQTKAEKDFSDAATQQEQAAQDSLIQAWKGDFEANKSTVRHTLQTLAAQSGVSPDDPHFAAIANNPALARIMLTVAGLTREDGMHAPAGFGDLRSPQQKADAIMDGSDPTWGKKYTEGSAAERNEAYNEVKRLLNAAGR